MGIGVFTLGVDKMLSRSILLSALIISVSLFASKCEHDKEKNNSKYVFGKLKNDKYNHYRRNNESGIVEILMNENKPNSWVSIHPDKWCDFKPHEGQ